MKAGLIAVAVASSLSRGTASAQQVAAQGTATTDTTAQSGLLFYLSGDRGLTADVARGQAEPNFANKVKVVPNGPAGAYVEAEGDQVLAWRAPGNVYAQRGTLAFLWRGRDPIGRMQFPVFRVGYADHSSWDMVWLRIDWNGHGFDAFVTDANLARTRVSYTMPVPRPDEWVHLAFAWDESRGVRLYVNGKLTAQKDTVDVYDAGLDQFGPHSRIISPYQVQSAYQFRRGGDIDEIRIYDHMLDDGSIATIAARGEVRITSAPRSLGDSTVRAEWWTRYGWNRRGDVPVYLSAPTTRIRKVEITDARDVKQRMMNGSDGIAETTWPGVYNRSRLPGRNDYFALPDWNVYVDGGKSVTFTLPDEPWNHIEVQGAASGTMSVVSAAGAVSRLGARPAAQERTWHQFAERRGGKLRFGNAAQETPIQELQAYDITTGRVPAGIASLAYVVRASADPAAYPALDSLRAFIAGRYAADERQSVVALPAGAPVTARGARAGASLPIVHVLIPADVGAPGSARGNTAARSGWDRIDGGLDGIALELPALHVRSTHGEFVPLNIQIKDPLWPPRNLLDVSVSVKQNEARTLWLDTRDRLLPNGYSLYLTIASASPDFDARQLEGATVRLVFKPRQAALAEHVADRFAQASDNMAFDVEEHPTSRKYARYERLTRDLADLLHADPRHEQGQYLRAELYQDRRWPAFVQPTAPAGVPLWAFRQVENLKLVRKFVDWWIDERQVAYGDFGGGISDDVDLTEQWPGLALMGVEPDKIARSLRRLSDAVDRNGMITNGLGTIRADELHSYEEGINVRSEDMYLHYGDPKTVEHLMETARAYPRITEVNSAGHRHIVSNLFSGTDVVREGIWQWSRPYSQLILHPGELLVDFNENPRTRSLLLELADGWLAHGKLEASGAWTYPYEVYWPTDEARGAYTTGQGGTTGLQLFQAAYRWTDRQGYIRPLVGELVRDNLRILGTLNENLLDRLSDGDSLDAVFVKAANGPARDRFAQFAVWQRLGDKHYLERLYADDIQLASQRMYMMTEAAWWSDRVEVPSDILQRSRLGGVALKRNQTVPGHLVSWRFTAPAAAERVAILVQGATPTKFRIIAYNLDAHAVSARMTGWELAPGEWRMRVGTDANGDDRADAVSETRTFPLERTRSVDVSFAPRTTTILELELVKAGPQPSSRPDLGIGEGDVRRIGADVEVTVHGLGSVGSPAGVATLEDATGRVLATTVIPPIGAPLDLVPKTTRVTLHAARGASLRGASVRVRLDGDAQEITQLNNRAPVP